MSSPLLVVDDIYAGYQDFDILKGVSLAVYPGEIVCVIGPNGAGKSTVFKAVYGFVRVRRGIVRFDGQVITNSRPQDVLSAGISIVPQLRSVFAQMTVIENLEMGMYLENDQARIRQRIQYIFELFPRLAERRGQMAGTMSGGEQRMLEIGRMIFENTRRLNRENGLTVLMIEQNARQGLEASHRGYVLELGRNAYEGEAQALLDNRDVRRAFLGGS